MCSKIIDNLYFWYTHETGWAQRPLTVPSNIFPSLPFSFFPLLFLSFSYCWISRSAAAAAKSLHVSDSVRPRRRQPTRLPRPWDSPGKNTGVGCHFLLQCMRVKSESEVAQSCLTPSDPMDYSLSGSSVHGIHQARVLEWVAIAFSRKCQSHSQIQAVLP